jgi:hypothetical protein
VHFEEMLVIAEVFVRSFRQLLVTANVSSSLILVTLMMQALCSFETSVHTKARGNHIPEDSILHVRF